MTNLAAKREELIAKRRDLAEIFEQAGAEYDLGKVTKIDGDTKGKVEEIQRRNRELDALADEVKDLEETEGIARKNREQLDRYSQPVGIPFPTGKTGGHTEPEVKGIRGLLEASAEYKAFREGRIKTAVIEIPEHEIKTLMTLTTINNVATRRPGIIESVQEMRTVRDLMLDGTTDNNTLTYMEETTFTNAAANVSEGGTKPESALAFTERTDNVRKIATWIPATAELLADVSGIESYIRGRLMFMVKRQEETQLLLGDGNAPNILGVELRTGVQTQAKGADAVPSAVYKAMTLVRNTGFAEPTAAVFHPNDWQDIKLLQTTDGIYIYGGPATEGPDRIWGLEVRVTTAQTQNTGFVGAFRPDAQVFQREGITVTVSTEHSTYFVENKVAILAEERLALAVYRPTSFCKITGI